MKGNWEWDLIPGDKVEWIILASVLVIVLGAAVWIFR